MFKFVLSVFVCLAFAVPASAQCCDCAPACNAPQKRLGIVPVERCLPQISLKCTTDSCGCSRRKLSVERVKVTGAKLGLVDRKPCGGGLRDMLGGLRSLGSNLGGGGCGCGAPAPAPAPSCGCSAAAPSYEEAAPVYDSAPAYESGASYESVIEAAPVADCGCNG